MGEDGDGEMEGWIEFGLKWVASILVLRCRPTFITVKSGSQAIRQARKRERGREGEYLSPIWGRYRPGPGQICLHTVPTFQRKEALLAIIPSSARFLASTRHLLGFDGQKVKVTSCSLIIGY